MSLVPKLVQVTVPEGVSPGDTINVEAEGQTVQCQVPEGLKPGDTFQVQTATQPVVPPHAVREGQVVHGSITDEEKHCLDLRFSTRIIAVVDIVLSVFNVIFGSFWALIMVVAAVCGLIGAQVFNGCLVVTYAAVSWAYVFGQILNIIIVTILFFGRDGRIYNSGSHRNWNTGFYVAFMIFAIIFLCETPAPRQSNLHRTVHRGLHPHAIDAAPARWRRTQASESGSRSS